MPGGLQPRHTLESLNRQKSGGRRGAVGADLRLIEQTGGARGQAVACQQHSTVEAIGWRDADDGAGCRAAATNRECTCGGTDPKGGGTRSGRVVCDGGKKPVRRPGQPGGEVHRAGISPTHRGGVANGRTTAVSGGDTSTVYFTAGLAGAAHGLFAAIANDTTTAGTPAFGVSAATSALTVSSGGAAASTVISVAPTYGFNGTVLLTCNGLPAGTSCLFYQPQISTNGTAPATTLLTIQTFQSVARLQTTRHGVVGVASALLFPFASFLVFYRRRSRAFSNA